MRPSLLPLIHYHVMSTNGNCYESLITMLMQGLFTFVSDIFEGLPVDELDDVAASQSLVDNLQEHAHKHHRHN